MNNKSAIAPLFENMQLQLQQLEFRQSQIQQSQQIQQQFLLQLQQSQQIQQQFLLQLQQQSDLNVPTIVNGTLQRSPPNSTELLSGKVSNATRTAVQQSSPGLIGNSSTNNIIAPLFTLPQDNRQQEKTFQANATGLPSGKVSNATRTAVQQSSPGLIGNSSTNNLAAESRAIGQNEISELQTGGQRTGIQGVGAGDSTALKDIQEKAVSADINATKIQEQKSLVLGPSIKNLIILIPNEAHHGPNEERETRLIDQPFVPVNATVGRGTNVVWYNADVDHEHTLNLYDTKNTSGGLLGGDGDIDYNDVLAYTFDAMGSYRYHDTQEYDENFQMSGMLNVVDPKTLTSDSTESEIETVGTLIVPSDELENYLSQFKDSGIAIHDVHRYQDPAGDDKQLIVWTSTGVGLQQTLEEIKDITSDLPYE
jgi:plastocyanin